MRVRYGKCVSIDDPKKAPGTAARPKRVNAQVRYPRHSRVGVHRCLAGIIRDGGEEFLFARASERARIID